MDLTDTIAPKSDQLNATDMIAGDMTISVTDIKASDPLSESPHCQQKKLHCFINRVFPRLD